MAGSADESYKFGAGRYLQSRALLERAGEEIVRYGRKPYIICGPTALTVVRPRLSAGLAAAGLDYVFDVHPGQVCHEAARAKAEAARANGCDVVVGVGGGRMMDFAKLCAYYLGTRLVQIPTSSSTCAAYTPFSLIYTAEGQTIPGNFCYDQEIASILVDLDVMAGQPVRYLVAGILDAMGKFQETKNGHTELVAANYPMSLCAGYCLAQFSYEKLWSLADQVCRDVAARQVTPALEEVVFLNLPLTGMISALSRGVGQSAIAHELYYQARLLFTKDSLQSLHGEIVGVGIIIQMHYNGASELIAPFISLLQRLGAPTCLSEIGIAPTEDNCRILCNAIGGTSFISQDAQAQARLAAAFSLIAH